ncbi:DUF222 domain-containing protein [Kocuria sp. M1R5S2]|uniref:HNH endonuclease signature motif containing protein n=1 Tax=Kocuria rhizosphaerae TaxID=3376285 RepID=UPI00379AB3DF
MTATARRRKVTPEPGEELLEWSFYLADESTGARREEVRAAATGLREAVAAEGRAFGAQVRCIHRLWLAAQAARTAARHEALAQAEAAAAGGGEAVRQGPWGVLLEPEHELVVDVAAEVGAAMRLPAGTARARVQEAVVLAETLPEVLAALEEGRIGAAQAAVMVDQWQELIGEDPMEVPGHAPVPPPVEAVHRLVAELLERAPHATAAQLRSMARERRRVLVAEADERGRRAARKHRAVWVEAAPEGMAYLHALLEAPVAVAVHSRLEELAALMGEEVPAPGLGLFPDLDVPEHAEARSGGELRADALADLLLYGVLPQEPSFPRGVRATVSVMVPVSVLTAEHPAGTDAAPTGAETTGAATGAGCPAPVLSGYGPISAEVARQLAAGAGAWHRLLTHPVTGVVLDHDRTVYTVPADLRRLVELRDGTCRFPGCRRRAEACDLDHTVAWAQGGATAEHNLAALCRHHHRIKHRTGHLGAWTVRRVPAPPGGGSRAILSGSGAELEWISPGGLVHRTVPEHQVPGPGPRIGDPPPYWSDEDPAPF